NEEAVTHGLAATGKTITAAAAIMVLVFAAFILGGERVIELFGLGLAGAVFLDALVVRSVLVPGLMLLAGKANWWLPQSLDRRLRRGRSILPAPRALQDPRERTIRVAEILDHVGLGEQSDRLACTRLRLALGSAIEVHERVGDAPQDLRCDIVGPGGSPRAFD